MEAAGWPLSEIMEFIGLLAEDIAKLGEKKNLTQRRGARRGRKV